jgi:phage tail-like protein
MRFAVLFTSGDGITDLGEWSSCKGLKVDFKTEPVKFGGEYDHEVKLPLNVSYGPVVLERAMEQKYSHDLQVWLGNLVANWMNDTDDGYSPPEASVHIILQDVHQTEVASWTLRNAYPASWSGPTLDAKGSTIAIETLTLEHQGFLPMSAGAGD